MTATPGGELERETFPELVDELGEDPARYLDRDLAATDASELFVARVRGLRDPQTVLAFRHVERHELERGPREAVLEWLSRAERAMAVEHARAARRHLARPFAEWPHAARLVLAREWRERLAPVAERVDGDHPSPRERLVETLEGRDLDEKARKLGASGALEAARNADTTEKAELGDFGAEAVTDGGESS